MTTQSYVIVALVAAHLLGDFVLQSKRMADRKTRPHVLIAHASIVALLSYILVGARFVWQVPAVVLATHALIDFIKVKSKRRGLVAFSIDQLAHAAVIVVLAYRIVPTTTPLFWADRFGSIAFDALIVVSGAILATVVAGVVISKAIAPFQNQLAGSPETSGFLAGGSTIGRLERFLIFVLVLMGETGAIGFLVAAKSLLRFGELRHGDRKEAEYVIIGTMWSFACGLVVALATRAMIGR
ncbi:MAG: DUF3307 domain-containing protein [Candidatus Latescibacteria bacterium]|nr:DUF3307 domain-containing protein [Candidatus Latescibacterota bacterium]